MRRLSFVPGMLLMALLVSTVASASPITVVDPIIGVRGGMFGSDPVDSGSPFTFQECPEALPGFVQCVVMNISDSAFSAGISSITLHIVSSTNAEFSMSDEGSPSPFSFGTPLENGDLRFSGDGPLMCSIGIEESHPCGTIPGEDIAFVLQPIIDPDNPDHVEDVPSLGLSAQVVAVNDTPLNPVPEPGSLLLMGTGIATLAGRRLRKKSG